MAKYFYKYYTKTAFPTPILLERHVKNRIKEAIMRVVKKSNTKVSNSSRKLMSILSCMSIEESEEKVKLIKDCVDDTYKCSAYDQLTPMGIYKFYRDYEKSSLVNDKTHKLKKISTTRAVVVNWLIEKHHYLDLRPETLYLCIYIFDKFLSMEETVEDLKLVGISAMFLACKYEQIQKEVDIHKLCISCSPKRIVSMESKILKRLHWRLTFPTPYNFIVCLLKIAPCSEEMKNMVFFFAELGMVNYLTRKYHPSKIAASAFYTARCILDEKPFWPVPLEGIGYCELQLMDCAQLMMTCHGPESKSKEVYEKYSNPEFGAVALYPPVDAKTLRMLRVRRRELLRGASVEILQGIYTSVSPCTSFA